MRAERYDTVFESILTRVRQPARLIGEEAGAGPGFSGAPDQLRVVLGFPDTYEIAISNQALQILYHLARCEEGVGVERAYLPWVDAIAEMRRLGVPLLTLEGWTPVAECHLLGVTLQHEFHYTNLLEMLDLAGIPLGAGERAEEDPLVLVGGPACANFAPIGPIVDAVAVGDGEVLLPDILREMVAARRRGALRDELKGRLAAIEGVFVPGASRRVKRRAIARLEEAPYPASCLVPLVAGVHDRAWVEVMRGCTRGCRFCQAGMWYRPVRERPARDVLRLAQEEVAQTGHQELALASLSTTDYSCLQDVLNGVAETLPEVSLSLPSLRVDSASVRLAWLASPTGASITLAPEAGSQRMRDIINKNVTEDEVLAAAKEAFRTGRTTLKLYFMIGLPWEMDADVEAIADLCLKVRRVGRQTLGARASRLQLNVSVNTFIPKPFTPFQWAAMADRETVRRRQELLRERLRRPGIRLAMPDPSKSYLEAALARGGEAMSLVIEAAWRRGARFDAWTEQFQAAAWAAAFEEWAAVSAEEAATTPLEGDQQLPWDIVEGVPDHGFLWNEWKRASRGEVSGDCRWDGCELCGACDVPPGNVVAKAGPEPREVTEAEPAVSGATAGQAPAGSAGEALPEPLSVATAISAVGAGRRYVARFSVTGRGRFLGHLDRQEAFRRAVRRAGGRLALSAGMRPKPVLTLALPLGVGIEGLQELCEFELIEEPAEDFSARLAAALPGHMQLLELVQHGGGRRLAARVTGASYEVEFSAREAVVADHGEAVVAGHGEATAVHDHEPVAGEDRQPTALAESPRLMRRGEAGDESPFAAALAEGARRLVEAGEWVIEERREGRSRTVDIRSHIEQMGVQPLGGGVWRLSFTAAVTPNGTAKPDLVLKVLGQASGMTLEPLSMRRTGIRIR